MPVGGNTSGGGTPPTASPTILSQGSAHSLFVTLAAEMTGVAVLAVFADMSDELGGIAVALMGGWFLLFLMTNAPILATLESKLQGG